MYRFDDARGKELQSRKRKDANVIRARRGFIVKTGKLSHFVFRAKVVKLLHGRKFTGLLRQCRTYLRRTSDFHVMETYNGCYYCCCFFFLIFFFHAGGNRIIYSLKVFFCARVSQQS